MTTSLPDIPGYEILAELGRGATGVVYKAQGPGINRIVALKLLHKKPTYDYPVRAQRLLLEAEATASLEHPNIVAVYSVGEFQGQPYIAREFLDGVDLKEAVQTRSIGQRQGIMILALIARGIACAHTRGLVHRNLTTSNILVGNGGDAKLIGFSQVRVDESVMLHGLPATKTIDIQALQELLRWLFSALGEPMPGRLAAALATDPPSATAFAEILESFGDKERKRARPGLLKRLTAWLH